MATNLPPPKTAPVVGASHHPMKRIYMYNNDPSTVNKGVFVTNFKNLENSFMPLLSDVGFQERKAKSTSYVYDNRRSYGQRPMHKTTFSLSGEAPGVLPNNTMITTNEIVSILLEG